jgi:hypothetical protein
MSLVKHLVHLLLPHESNNQKAKILHSSSLLVIALILLIYQIVLVLIPKTGIRILGYAANISVDEVVRLTNEKRAQAGLSQLVINGDLSRAAKAKGDDMLARDYWAHVAPDGTEPWKFFKDVSYNYRYAGENLARDFSDASSAVDAWIASPSHRENLMSPKYKDIGIAVVEGDLAGSDTTIIVQLFGTRLADTLPAVPIAKAQTIGPSPKASFIPGTINSPSPAPIAISEIKSDTSLNRADTSGGVSYKPSLLSPFTSTRGISLLVVSILLIVMVVDGFVINRKGISRVAGRTFAHLSFFGMILAIILILKAGEIL